MPIPPHFLTTSIDSPEAIDEIISYHQKTGEFLNKWLVVAYLVLTKTQPLRQLLMQKMKELRTQQKLMYKQKQSQKHMTEEERIRHHLCSMLARKGVRVDANSKVVETILKNKDSITYIEFVGEKQRWKVVSLGEPIIGLHRYSIQFDGDKIQIKVSARPSKKVTELKKKPKSNRKWRRCTWKVGKPKKTERSSVFTVYNEPARIIYTPMGGLNRRR